MSDSLNNKELVAVGHQFAKAMSADTPIIDMAKIVSRLAERLDCTAAALREMTKKRDAEHTDVLVWEKTMFKVCGEDGPKSVADKFAELQAKCAALAAENGMLKSVVEGWADTPTTDAFLAEVRAQGVERFAVWNDKHIEKGDEHEDVLVEVGRAARGFAAQLRQEAAK